MSDTGTTPENNAGPLPSGKYEQDIYYRKPDGWIVVGPSRNGTCVTDFIRRGFEPLYQYGGIPNDPVHWEDSHWTTILQHPAGPAEFPVDQVLTLRWYTEEDCPIPGVVFPQLKGHKVKEWPCVEHDCVRKFYGFDDDGKGPPALANHLRIIHRWGVQDIIALGSRLGIDFNELYRGMGEPTDIDLEAAPEVSFDCPDCDWTPKTDAKRPDTALLAHKRAAHPELVVEVATP